MFKEKFSCLTTGIGIGVILILPGCGGGSPGVAPAITDLAISGTPATSITEGLTYTFVPTSNVGGLGSLRYSITNRPSWASFDVDSGALAGTPGMAHIGTTSGIIISVSRGLQNSALTPFDIEVVASANGVATLSWTPPTHNTDGSLLGSDLAGYRVHYGATMGVYPNSITISNSTVISDMVENLSPGTWHFVVTALNQAGRESDYSNTVSKMIPSK